MAQTLDGRYVNMEQFLQLFPMARSSFYNIVGTDKLPPSFKVGGKRYFSVEDIEKWTESKKTAKGK